MNCAHDEFRRRQHELFKGYPPSWHAAIDAGHDMTLVAEALRKTPGERLHDLQRALDRLFRMKAALNAGHTTDR